MPCCCPRAAGLPDYCHISTATVGLDCVIELAPHIVACPGQKRLRQRLQPLLHLNVITGRRHYDHLAVVQFVEVVVVDIRIRKKFLERDLCGVTHRTLILVRRWRFGSTVRHGRPLNQAQWK